VLTCLVSQAGQVVTKDEMLRTVWPDSFVEEGNLAQHVLTLRRALGDRADWIKTVPGRGYQFTAPVRERSLTTTRTEEAGPAVPGLFGGVTVQRTRESAHLVIEESAAIAAPSSPLEPPGIRAASRSEPESISCSPPSCSRPSVLRSGDFDIGRTPAYTSARPCLTLPTRPETPPSTVL